MFVIIKFKIYIFIYIYIYIYIYPSVRSPLTLVVGGVGVLEFWIFRGAQNISYFSKDGRGGGGGGGVVIFRRGRSVHFLSIFSF